LYRSLARLTRDGTLATLTVAGPGAALFRLAGVYRAGPGEDGQRTAAMPLGGFLDRIAEAITRAGAAAGWAARDPGPGRAGSSALARGTRGPRQ
jgi:hypothetical protein